MTYLLIFFGIMYLGAPLVIWATQRQTANPKLEPYGMALADPKFQFLTTAAAQMQSLGFELIGYFGYIGQTRNVNAFIAYLVHRKNGDAGIAAVMETSAGITARTVEFATRFFDQSSITTGNSRTPGVYIRPRTKPVYHFPWIADPARLYDIHQQLMLRDKLGMAKDPAQPGHEQERLLEGIRAEMKDQLEPGILRLDASGTYYRPTLWGAYLMAWKLLFPVKQIRVAIKTSKAQRLARSLMANRIFQPIHPM
jgi:hypothetical protein